MGLRAKLPTTFLVLLATAIIAASAIHLDRMLRLMAHQLVTSADRCGKEVFEQVRLALSQPGVTDPALTLRDNGPLQAAIRSSLAFSEYVVYLRIVSIDGKDLVGSDTDTAADVGTNKTVLPITDLEQLSDSPWPLSLVRALWSDHVYEMNRSIDVNSHPFGFIKVGVSTGLIASQVHRVVEAVAIVTLVAVIITMLVALALTNLMLRPVLAVTSSMEQLAAGNADVKLDVPGCDEFSNLADKFNVLSRRIRAERHRWESERGGMFDALRSIRDAVLLIDSDGTLLFSNTEAQDVLGLPSGGAGEGKSLRLLVGAEHPLMQLIGPALAAGTEVRDVAFEIGDRFERRRFLVSILALGQGGRESAGLLVIMRDLEQMSELESVVDQSSRLARLGTLLSGVAHQIRTPLNVMTLQLELLRQDLDSGRDADPRIARVSQEIGRLAKAIDALMRFMRPEQLKREELAVNNLIREIGNQFGRPNLRVEYELDPNLPNIQADRDLLSEALRNMVNNGVEAMPQGGVMTLSTGNCGAEMVEIGIKDCGSGIAPEDLEQIFNLYFTTKERGNGLGLSLALRAIDLHGGSVNVESQVGAGTTFKIQLPADNGVPPRPTVSEAD